MLPGHVLQVLLVNQPLSEDLFHDLLVEVGVEQWNPVGYIHHQPTILHTKENLSIRGSVLEKLKGV